MQQTPVRLRVLLFLAGAGEDGRYRWDVEREFPESQVRTVLTLLVRDGFAREEFDGNKKHGPIYIRTGKPLGPQQKLEAFVGVPA